MTYGQIGDDILIESLAQLLYYPMLFSVSGRSLTGSYGTPRKEKVDACPYRSFEM
jgi:hypothetical protein